MWKQEGLSDVTVMMWPLQGNGSGCCITRSALLFELANRTSQERGITSFKACYHRQDSRFEAGDWCAEAGPSILNIQRISASTARSPRPIPSLSVLC